MPKRYLALCCSIVFFVCLFLACGGGGGSVSPGTAKKKVESVSTKAIPENTKVAQDSLRQELTTVIPGLQPEDVYSIFTKKGFTLTKEFFPTFQDSGIQFPQHWKWMCNSETNMRHQLTLDVEGNTLNDVTFIRGTYISLSSETDSNFHRNTNKAAAVFLGNVANAPYDGSRQSTAKSWVIKNIGRNNLKKVIGGVRFEVIANPNAPRTRILIMKLANEAPPKTLIEPKKLDSKTQEKAAQNLMRFAKERIEKEQPEKAKKWLDRIIERYPKTKVAKEAKRIIDELDFDEYICTYQAAGVAWREENNSSEPVTQRVKQSILPHRTIEIKKSKNSIATDSTQSSTDDRVQWVNVTYKTTVRRTKNGDWEEIDEKTGHVIWMDQEVTRTTDYVELFCTKRKYKIRLFAKRMELWKGGKWQRVANGHWEKSSVGAKPDSRVTPRNKTAKTNESKKTSQIKRLSLPPHTIPNQKLSDAEAFIRKAVTLQKDYVKAYNSRIKFLKRAYKSQAIRRSNKLGSARNVRENIKKLESQLKIISSRLPTPQLSKDFKVGDIGTIPNRYGLEVKQIVGPKALLIETRKPVKRQLPSGRYSARGLGRSIQNSLLEKTRYSTDRLLWIEGIKKVNVIIGKVYKSIPGVFRVIGTKTYKTLLGSNTVLLLRQVDVKAIQPQIEKWSEEHKLKAKQREIKLKPFVNDEKRAASKLRLAKLVLKKNKSRGKKWLQDLVKNYPGTAAAKEAQELLKRL